MTDPQEKLIRDQQATIERLRGAIHDMSDTLHLNRRSSFLHDKAHRIACAALRDTEGGALHGPAAGAEPSAPVYNRTSPVKISRHLVTKLLDVVQATYRGTVLAHKMFEEEPHERDEVMAHAKLTAEGLSMLHEMIVALTQCMGLPQSTGYENEVELIFPNPNEDKTEK